MWEVQKSKTGIFFIWPVLVMFWENITMTQIRWRRLTHLLGDLYSYILRLHTYSYLIRYFLSAFTCDVPESFLLVFQMFNRETHKHNEAPEKVLTVCAPCVPNLRITLTYLKSLIRFIAHVFFFVLFF